LDKFADTQGDDCRQRLTRVASHSTTLYANIGLRLLPLLPVQDEIFRPATDPGLYGRYMVSAWARYAQIQ